MGCDFYEERIMEYLDGALDARGKRDLEQHLSKCVHCSEFLEAMQRQYVMLSDLPLLSPGQNFTQKVMTKIYNEKAERNIPIVMAIPALLLAILAVTILLAPYNPADIIPAFIGAVGWFVMVVKSVSGILNTALWMAGFTVKVIMDLQSALTFPARILAEIWRQYPMSAVLVIGVFIVGFSLWVRLLAPTEATGSKNT
ncbi:hypothetical protein D2962_14695 [Biomaibacter acetigenes]|uniref:Anti-sigma-W factor RsiW n=1 Tax=Biomaibacter acetigenes TaxID=2316383 RepID=A0A3G2R9I0_9FIRM|nr:zf-HC2 domain-containing protein [Biomaibacter acetigenes]AYO31678.1 hypothetical protein D2962_14695 [Biomaibacter acetigenes]